MTGKQADRDDETHRRFRAALDRKKASEATRDEGTDATGAGLRVHENEKRQRQFRRKAGG